MEALLEKEGIVESWNDERLNELSRRVDAGFERMATKEEMNYRFDQVDKRFNKIDAQFMHIHDRLDRLNHSLLMGACGVIAAVIANGIWG
jgi:hypothetical protein